MSNFLEQFSQADPIERIQAIQNSIQMPSLDLLAALETLAATDSEEQVRAAALAALNQPDLRALRLNRAAKLPDSSRRILLKELDAWQKQGLIGIDQAKALRTRYQISLPPAQPPATPEPAPAPPKAPVTLAQTLLSETAIKLFLYLGAFFVISAAIILAALIEILRLPILLVATATFGVAALMFKKRLPQPSFVLFLVFSALFPINAGVLADLLTLPAQLLSAYWLLALLTSAALWAFATWFYTSRFFSMASLAAFVCAAYQLPGLLHPNPAGETRLLALALGNLSALLGIWLIITRKGKKFATPAFLFAQLLTLVIILVGLSNLFINLYEISSASTPNTGLWLNLAATWASIGLFYIFSHALLPVAIFPFFSIAALAPVLYLTLNALTLDQRIIASGWTAWAGLMALFSDLASRIHPKTREYNLPLTLASIVLFIIGSIWGLFQSTSWGFTLCATAAVLLTAIHIFQPRAWLWLSALSFGLLTYFLFFTLSFLPTLDEYSLIYQLTGATLLLLLPDLLLKSDWKSNPTWRYPLHMLGILLGTLTLAFILVSALGETSRGAICTFILSGFYLLYAIRHQKPHLGYLFTLHFSLGTAYTLNTLQFDNIFGALALLGLAYYAIGFSFHRFKNESWSKTLRWSGLSLALILTLVSFSVETTFTGWYIALFAMLFMAETGQLTWLEAAAPLLFSIGFSLTLTENKVQNPSYFLAGITILWLCSETAYQQALKVRPIRWITRLITAGLGLATALELWNSTSDYITRLVISLVLSAFLLGYSRLYRQPRLGYTFAAFFSLSAFFAARLWSENAWLGILISLAILYYLLSFSLKSNWATVWRFSGLALATLVSLAAPLTEVGIAASAPVALAATLWAVEAFRRRNVWLGFPANGLYLLAYFMILFSLEVTEPQFYSIGAALLGMLMHYLLLRTGSSLGAFVTGLVSQLILLGTTYIQMVSLEQLGFFAALFSQALIILLYGLIVRSRSLVGVPTIMLILGVTTVVFFILRGLSTVILIGCTGILMILLATLAVVLRERLIRIGEQLSGWKA